MSDTVAAPVLNLQTGPVPAAPLFRVDPGWMFVLAGLAVCVAGVLLPAQSDLHALRQQLSELKAEETRWYARLKAHGDFLDQVDRNDPDVVRRLAASQLNVIPSSETPVLLASTGALPLSQWIDNTVKSEPSPVTPLPISSLSRLANGPDRLWLFAGGIMCVFIGLLMGPGLARPRIIQSSSQPEPSYDDGQMTLVADDAAGDIDESSTSTVLVEANECDEDELLTEDQVLSNVLVEVPPASRTMENKELPEAATTAMSSATQEIGPNVETTAINVGRKTALSVEQDVLADADVADAEVIDLGDSATKPAFHRDVAEPSSDEEEAPRTPLVEAANDDNETDENQTDDPEDWPLTRRSHRSNRFEDSDESRERSSRD